MARIVDRAEALERLAEGNVLGDASLVHMEIMEPATRNVWLGTEPITREQYGDFDPGEGYVKSGAAEAPMDLVGFRRSPGAEADGPATRRQIAGRWFIHVAVPVWPPKRAHGLDGPMEVRVLKHQTVGFDSGRTLFVLRLPDGGEFIQQTGGRPDAEQMALPEGWSLRGVDLEEPITVEMQDEGPLTLWFADMVSFQGPVEGLPLSPSLEST
jgi:hypothetical protein